MISVIGGSGFIGTSLCKKLEKEGLEFIILDRNISSCFPNKSLITDINDIDHLRKNLSGEIIINLAAVHRDDVKPVDLYYKVNCEGSENLCRVAEEKNINQIVFLSTVAVYGLDSISSEESALNPFNHYGKSKKIAEEIFHRWYEDNKNKSLTIIRPTAVFGKGNRGNIHNLINQIYSGKFLMIGKGDNIKSIAYVENLSSFIVYTLGFDKGLHLFNYADKPDLTTKELVNRIFKNIEKKIPPFYIPSYLGLFAGYIFDFLAFILNKKLNVSSIRIKKFISKSIIETKAFNTGFTPPIKIEKAIDYTIEEEFLKR